MKTICMYQAQKTRFFRPTTRYPKTKKEAVYIYICDYNLFPHGIYPFARYTCQWHALQLGTDVAYQVAATPDVQSHLCKLL